VRALPGLVIYLALQTTPVRYVSRLVPPDTSSAWPVTDRIDASLHEGHDVDRREAPSGPLRDPPVVRL